MRPIRVEKDIIVYYGNRVGRLEKGCARVDPMFEGQDLKAFLASQKSICKIQWEAGIFEQMMDAPKEGMTGQVLKACRIWQLRPDVDIRMKFIGYEQMCREFGLPVPEDYQLVYDGAVKTNDLGELYAVFNIAHPEGYRGHSLSMSDVVELYDRSGSEFYYVDRIGFQQIRFEPPEQQTGYSQHMQF